MCMCMYRSRVGMEEGEKVELSDLTWEQKEQVLKFLFFKMNHQAKTTPTTATTKPLPLLPINNSSPAHQSKARATPPVFITQQTSGGPDLAAVATPTSQRRVVSGQAS